VPANGQYVSITWDALDRESSRFLSSVATSVEHTYDAAGRETGLANNTLFAPNFTNYYDPNNNRIGVVESTGGTVSYAYDPTSQLTYEQRTGSNAFNTTYTWDPLGVRHEVAQMIVARPTGRCDPAFHRRYATSYCGEVMNRGKHSNNVSRPRKREARTVRGGPRCKHQCSKGQACTARLM